MSAPDSRQSGEPSIRKETDEDLTTLRFSPKVLEHLGEKLVPNIDQALVELVKNAFDADAATCEVRIIDDPNGSNTIIVKDNGEGMSLNDLKNKWLLLGTSTKRRAERTSRFDRITVGDKGLGRLAALRLGSEAELTTYRRGEDHSYSVTLAWADFNSKPSVDLIPLTIKELPKRQVPGTAITIRGCPSLNDAKLKTIANVLLLVSDPFSTRRGFRVRYTGSAVKRADVGFSRRFFKFARYVISGRLRPDGQLSAAIKGAGINQKITFGESYETAPFTFQLWEYSDRRTFSITDNDAGPRVQRWLRTFGGIHLFNGPIRIAPQGDKPVDWLELNLARVRSPENRPSTNNSIGRIVINNFADQIEQTTDRVSFVENSAYRDLKAACVRILDWAAEVREKDRDRRKLDERLTRPDHLAMQRSVLDKVKDLVAPDEYVVIAPLIREAFTGDNQLIDFLRQDVVFYRAMSTAGITANVYWHEIGQPLDAIAIRVPKLEQWLSGNDDALTALRWIATASERLLPLIQLPAKYAGNARKRSRLSSTLQLVRDSLALLGPLLNQEHVKPTITPKTAHDDQIRAAPSMIDAVLGNLVVNSITAFKRDKSKNRRILIDIAVTAQKVTLTYNDSAGGIHGLPLDDLWLPGKSTKRNGTGFGLTIVRDTVLDLGGTIRVAPQGGRLGGALFRITLPKGA